MTTDRTAALADIGSAGSAPELDLNVSDPSEATPHVGSAAAVTARQRPAASAETQRLYAADWRVFEDWCRQQNLAPLPAEAATVIVFLSEGATRLGVGALSRRAAAIAARHRQSGLASPTADPAVTAILGAARRTATPRRPAPKPPAMLTRMAARCPRDLADTRDRAVLLLAANGLGRAALVGLDVEHVRFCFARNPKWGLGSLCAGR